MIYIIQFIPNILIFLSKFSIEIYCILVIIFINFSLTFNFWLVFVVLNPCHVNEKKQTKKYLLIFITIYFNVLYIFINYSDDYVRKLISFPSFLEIKISTRIQREFDDKVSIVINSVIRKPPHDRWFYEWLLKRSSLKSSFPF